MIKEIVISGPDARNVVTSAVTLAAAGRIDHGYAALIAPGVGAAPTETVRCWVVISSSPIPTPTTVQPDIAVAMDHRAAVSCWRLLKPKGCLFFNSETPIALTRRGLCRVACLNCRRIAAELGAPELAFLVMLAGMAKHTELVTGSTLRKAYRRKFSRLGNDELQLRDLALEKGFTEGDLAFYGHPADADAEPTSTSSTVRKPFPVAL